MQGVSLPTVLDFRMTGNHTPRLFLDALADLEKMNSGFAYWNIYQIFKMRSATRRDWICDNIIK